MTHNFCTLFDKNFLARGLALHESLDKQCPDFMLWILCMDDESYTLLGKLKLKNVSLLRLSEVEDARLLAVKASRTPVEYCWMFSSALPLYLLEKNHGMETIAYLDADMYFYAPVDDIYREFGQNSIMIVPHGFSPKNKWREKTSGTYNVAMMIFRNDQNALTCLRWWKDRVIEWCYNRYEDGKLGDQLYLNDWPTRFGGVHVLKHPGANVASWSVDRFDFKQEKGGFGGTEKKTGRMFPLIFYHFHGLKIFMTSNGKIRPYPITIYQKVIYQSYISALQRAYDRARAIDSSWDHGCAPRLDILRIIKQYIGLWFRKRS